MVRLTTMAVLAVAAACHLWVQAAPGKLASDRQTRARRAGANLTWQGEEPQAQGNTMDGSCPALIAARDKAAQLFTKRLTRGEYEKRNFMWMRCRFEQDKSYFDVGGSWPGPQGEHLKDFLTENTAPGYPVGPLLKFAFQHVNADEKGEGGWGDAYLWVMLPWLYAAVESKFGFRPMPLLRVVEPIVQFGQSVAEQENRTFYVIDCPTGRPEGKYFRGYGTEAKSDKAMASYFTGDPEHQWSTGGN
ncbi:hypothetical protein Purlil1_7453 [Purpureocillium lilacinum]|uniref:Uncharacterized protein n=1 Tax=Purpureocillium lilacinum TaxID=33203 RepID=A0ABR0BWA2_PURLI|nr:hypothetical protein Purlil1_7453 [Purpureocillium lilacinum]